MQDEFCAKHQETYLLSLSLCVQHHNTKRNNFLGVGHYATDTSIQALDYISKGRGFFTAYGFTF